MSLTAIVPLKALSSAKQRLSADLDPGTRRHLVAWMFDRVIRACLGAGEVTDVLVVAGDDEAATAAARHPVDILIEPVPGLSRALDAADEALADRRATLVVAADLPLATGADIDLVCAAGRQGPCVIVAPTDDGGTGALLRCPPGAIPTAYGPGSASAHLRAGREHGLRTARIRVPGLAFDIDTAGQLQTAEIDLASVTSGRSGYPPRGAGVGLTRDRRSFREQEHKMPQGTVKYFDIETRTGTVLLDDQEELPIDAETFAASGMIELRLGQRVRFMIDEEGGGRRVRNLHLVSF